MSMDFKVGEVIDQDNIYRFFKCDFLVLFLLKLNYFVVIVKGIFIKYKYYIIL